MLLILGMFFVALIFTFQNDDHRVPLTFGSHTTEPLPIFIIMLGAFLLGVIFTSIIGIIEGMKMRVSVSKLKRKVKQYQAELDALRNLPLAGPSDSGEIPEGPLDDEDSAL